jgi:hypothetical protein
MGSNQWDLVLVMHPLNEGDIWQDRYPGAA